MKTVHSKDFNEIHSVATEIYEHIQNKNKSEIIASINKMKSRTEFDLLCAAFYGKYKTSLYNKIFSFINLSDYQKIKTALRPPDN